MDVRSSLDGLKSILGIPQPGSAGAAGVRKPAAADVTGLDADHVTFSTAGNEVAQTASAGDVRADKVAQIQAALANGTYSVPASAVASRLVGSMLGER